MARIRSVKPQLRTSLTVAEWPREVRYFWVLLWGYLDDHGRGVDDARLIKADCFPLDDDLNRVIIDDWLTMISKTPDDEGDLPTLCRYEVRGRHYVHAPKWTGHQRPQHPKDSEIPPCPLHDPGADRGDVREDVLKSSGGLQEDLTPEVEGVEGGGGVVGDGGGARPPDATRETSRSNSKPATVGEFPADMPDGQDASVDLESLAKAGLGSPGAIAPRPGGAPKSSSAKGTRIPDDFAVTPAMVAWAAHNASDVNGRRETEQFVNYWRAKAGKDATKVNWELTWRNWMLKAQTDAERNGTRASPRAKTSTTDERVGAALALAAEFRQEAHGQREISP